MSDCHQCTAEIECWRAPCPNENATQPEGVAPLTDIDQQIAALTQSICHAGRLRTDQVHLPGSWSSVPVTYPADTDRLLDQAGDDEEQNLPYWSELWPSGIALAAAIEQHPQRVRGLDVLELGCGVGVTAAMAVREGANLTVTDYAAEALVLTRMTSLRLTGREPHRAHRMNWRNPGFGNALDQTAFDVVLGADLLYERRDIGPLVAAVETLVKPGGALWLAEPGRTPARMFLDRLEQRGWSSESSEWTGPWPNADDAGVTVQCHWLTRILESGT